MDVYCDCGCETEMIESFLSIEYPEIFVYEIEEYNI